MISNFEVVKKDIVQLIVKYPRGGSVMDAMTYSAVEKDLKKVMDYVCDAHDVMIVARDPAPAVVLMSLEDFSGIKEMMYLLGTPANAENLRESVRQYEQGKVKRKSIIED